MVETAGPAWLQEAWKYLGVKEIKGITHEPLILRMWKAIRLSGVKDDETPWCAAFVGAMLEAVDIVSSRSGWARSYMSWGLPLEYPVVGCIGVFSRAGGGGHVGFVVGMDAQGNPQVLGGNQSDEVNVKSIQKVRLLGYRWPKGVPVPEKKALPLVGGAPMSTREA